MTTSDVRIPPTTAFSAAPDLTAGQPVQHMSFYPYNYDSTSSTDYTRTAWNNQSCQDQYQQQPEQQQEEPEQPEQPPQQPKLPLKDFMHSDRQERTILVGRLVEISAELIDSIWYPGVPAKVMSTKNFIQEILRRSQATYVTLQMSLFYLTRVKRLVHDKLLRRSSPPSPPSSQDEEEVQQPVSKRRRVAATTDRTEDYQCCGRRMFLASLMAASKYLHDKNYKNIAWAKISGLSIAEVNAAEMAFLKLIDYKLFVSQPSFEKWCSILHGCIQKISAKSSAERIKDKD